LSPNAPILDATPNQLPSNVANSETRPKLNTPPIPPTQPTPQRAAETASQSSSKSAAGSEAEKGVEHSNGNKVNWDIYRDRNATPADPRKPCNSCTHPAASQPRCNCNLPGINGRPYQETEPGNCQCGEKHPAKHPEFSVHWPRPFSAKLDERNPARAQSRYSGRPQKRIVDVFNPLSTFKLSGYKRTDNGYCGPGADPYGCLGESKQSSRVAGVGYRFPSEPVPRGPVSVFNE